MLPGARAVLVPAAAAPQPATPAVTAAPRVRQTLVIRSQVSLKIRITGLVIREKY